MAYSIKQYYYSSLWDTIYSSFTEDVAHAL